MQPLIVDPNGYDKQRALSAALERTTAFLQLNCIEPVVEHLWAPDDAKKPPGKNPWHDNGWCWRSTIFVNLKRSRVPVKNPGFSWSFTGSKADLTAPGVLAHETGHHVHYRLDQRLNAEMRTKLTDCLDDLRLKEAPVSGYEPNAHEVMAEAMRLFILNPELLRAGRPRRWRFLTATLGLKPLHEAPWREVLVHAHPRLIASLEKWIER